MTTPDPAAGAAFLAVLPAVERHARFALRHLRAADHEDALAEAVALTWAAFVRL